MFEFFDMFMNDMETFVLTIIGSVLILTVVTGLAILVRSERSK